MAKPQKENGYTMIANEILEALISSGLTGSEYAVVLFIIRKTYGFNKTDDAISATQFEKHLPYSLRGIKKVLKKLILVNLVTLVNQGSPHGNCNVYRFNKNYEEWKVENKVVNHSSLVNHSSKGSEPQVSKVVNHSSPTKDIPTKDIIQKKEKSKELDLGKEVFGNVKVTEGGDSNSFHVPEKFKKQIKDRTEKYFDSSGRKPVAAIIKNWVRKLEANKPIF